MGMSMIQWVGADGVVHNLTPAASFEDAQRMVAPRQYLATRALDLFADSRVAGAWEASPGGAPINPEAAELIRSENASRKGPVFDLAAALEDPLAAGARMVGECPELFGESSMSVDFLVVKKGLEQNPGARLGPKAQRLIALAESIEDKSFSKIEVDAAFLERMAQAQERAAQSWQGQKAESERQERLIAQAKDNVEQSVGPALARMEIAIAGRQGEIAERVRKEQDLADAAISERDAERARLMRAKNPIGRAMVHLHRLFDGQYELPTRFDRSCAQLLASIAAPKDGSYDAMDLAAKTKRREELKGMIAEGVLAQEDAMAAVKVCMQAQRAIEDSMPSGLVDRPRFMASRSLEAVAARTGVFAYHALSSFHPELNSPLAAPALSAQKLHAIMAFAPSISCSTFKVEGGAFSGTSFGDQAGSATCVLIGSGVVESIHSSDDGTKPNSADPSTRGMSGQSAAQVDESIARRSANHIGYNEMVVAKARPVALFKSLDAMAARGGPISAQSLLAHIRALGEQAGAPLPGALPGDPSSRLPTLVLADGQIHMVDPIPFASLTQAELDQIPKAKSASEAMAILRKSHRVQKVDDLAALSKAAPWISDDQRLRAASGLMALYKEPYARSLMRQARAKTGVDRIAVSKASPASPEAPNAPGM